MHHIYYHEPSWRNRKLSILIANFLLNYIPPYLSVKGLIQNFYQNFSSSIRVSDTFSMVSDMCMARHVA